MAQITHHMAVNIEGFLRNYKGKSMAGLMNDGNGKELSNKEVRVYLAECQAKGWKKIPCSNNCEGFDYFDKGCPGHETINENPEILTNEKNK